jgi:fatty-acyl-CoA synthase
MAKLPESGIRNRDDLARFEAAMPLEQRLPERSVLDVFIGSVARGPIARCSRC